MILQSWIGVDFDGTLATYDGFRGPGHCGEPIPEMVERVRSWLRQGRTVKIFTARVAMKEEADEARHAIEEWCFRHLGQRLEVTCVKDYLMSELWDDRAVGVERNTGKILSGESRI